MNLLQWFPEWNLDYVLALSMMILAIITVIVAVVGTKGDAQ